MNRKGNFIFIIFFLFKKLPRIFLKRVKSNARVPWILFLMPLKKDWMKRIGDFMKYIMELGGPGEKMTQEKGDS